MLWLHCAETEHTPHVRFFALHCLEQLIFTRWKDLSPDAQQQVKDAMLQLMQNSVQDWGTEPLFIRTKVGKLVAEVAKREYPQRWPDFLDIMLQLWSTGSNEHAGLALMVMLYVLEDCINSDFNTQMSARRRKEILTAFNDRMKDVLLSFYAFMSSKFQIVSALVAAGDHTGAVVPSSLLNTGLLLANSIIEWQGVEEACNPDHDLLQMICHLLGYEAFQIRAADTLQVLCSPKLKPHLFLRFLQMLPPSIESMPEPSEFEQSAELFKRVAVAMSDLISTSMGPALEDPIMQTPEGREAVTSFLRVGAVMMRHQSRRVAAELGAMWKAVMHSPAARSLPIMNEVVSHLLQTYMDRITRVRWDDEDVTDDPIAAQEFGDKEEFKDFNHNYLRSIVSHLFGMIAKHFPALTCEFMATTVSQLVASFGQVADFPDARGFCTGDSTADLRWEVVIYVMGETLPKVPREVISGEQSAESDVDPAMIAQQRPVVVASFEQITMAMLQWNPTDPRLLYRRCGGLQQIASFLRYSEDVLVKVLTELFPAMDCQDIPFPAGSERSSLTNGQGRIGKSEDYKAVRARAAASISQIVNVCSATLVAQQSAILNNLLVETRNRINSGTLSPQVETAMYETLIPICEKIPDSDMQGNMLQDVLQVPVEQWIAAGPSVASAQALLTVMGAVPDADPNSLSVHQQAKHEYQKVFQPLVILAHAARRIRDPTLPPEWTVTGQYSVDHLMALHPFTRIWQPILNNVALLLQTLHEIWTPPVRAVLAPTHLGYLYYPVVEEFRPVSGEETATVTDPDQRPLVERWRYWLKDLRGLTYQMLGAACSQRVLYVHEAHTAVATTFLETLPYMESRHLTTMLKWFLESYVVHCPPGLYASSPIGPLLTMLFNHMVHRLTVAWADNPLTVTTAVPNSLPPDMAAYVYWQCSISDDMADPDSVQMARDRIKRDLARTYIETLQAYFGCRGSLVGEKRQAASSESASITEHELSKLLLFQDETITTAVLDAVFGLFSVPDAHTARRAVKLAMHIHHLTYNDARFFTPFGQQAVQTALEVLLKQPKWAKGMEWDYVGLLQVIYSSYVLGIVDEPHVPSTERVQRSDLPRHVFLQLPGVDERRVVQMEQTMSKAKGSKERRDAIMDVLRHSILAISDGQETSGQHITTDSALAVVTPAVEDLPEQYASRRQMRKQQEQEEVAEHSYALNEAASIFFDDDEL